MSWRVNAGKEELAVGWGHLSTAQVVRAPVKLSRLGVQCLLAAEGRGQTALPPKLTCHGPLLWS